MVTQVKIKNSQLIISSNMKTANSLFDRLLGLMFLKKMCDFDGLLLAPCNSIHTFFMRFEIDVLFLDKDFNIIKILKRLKPWRITSIYFKSKFVLELPGNTLPDNLKLKEQIEVINS